MTFQVDSTGQTALIVGATSVLTSALVAWFTGINEKKKIEAGALAHRQELEAIAAERRLEKQEDYRRQDEVARRAEEAARRDRETAAQILKNSLVLNRLDDATVEVKTNVLVQNGKLDEIHTLVNSNLTAAMMSELAAHKATLVLLEEKGHDALKAGETDTLKIKIKELEAVIAERQAQTVAAQQIAKQVSTIAAAEIVKHEGEVAAGNKASEEKGKEHEN